MTRVYNTIHIYVYIIYIYTDTAIDIDIDTSAHKALITLCVSLDSGGLSPRVTASRCDARLRTHGSTQHGDPGVQACDRLSLFCRFLKDSPMYIYIYTYGAVSPCR